jgi:acetyl-CoA carboxylase carboxyl transferase subunit beta
MGWLNREPAGISESSEKKAIPEGIWEKCPSCSEVVLASDWYENLRVCSSCGYHGRISCEERVEILLDKNTFYEWDHELKSTDPLLFNDGKSYRQKLETQWKKTSRYDAVVTGAGLMNGRPVALGVMDFFWMGGSMGTVVGERISRLFARAAYHGMPAVMVSSSGGARMHEGLLSLMQMAKTCSGISELRDKGLPYISVMCDPTTGGVAASFAMLGDLNFAEPKATIGFAGRRVIENTIRQKLPDDFQTAEFLLQHGMLDRIVKRYEMKDVISRCLNVLCPCPQ